ncbi:MAG: cell division protein ZipA [gamma proteobacterium symbiont of Lucinoma myriamae]|nr:cell division protein ZipA [gamma proteobacterium symbiont of Lucinoma myriamae]MCU7818296.1 cell division protein ZipA [gamma proteobacterium symbiont of Lucinoma myriamae]MCU7832149.1 cell division protein ZipA [gamma proteobacterium symbiont of Lucinoma myriamae]
MDELTFILILAGIGVVLLVAMFTYYKHHKKINDEIENFNQNKPASFKKTTETFASFVDQNNIQTETTDLLTDESTAVQDSSQKIKVHYDAAPEGVEEIIISHTILTKGEFFSGQQLYKALLNAGLSYGEMNIFHYPGDNKPETFALFSIANIIEPGTFDLLDDEMKTPGISIFMRLPTRMGCDEAYDKFIHVAQMIAADLGGELCDETRSQLTQQVISYKKEQIKKLKFEMEKAKKLADMGH